MQMELVMLKDVMLPDKPISQVQCSVGLDVAGISIL